MLPNAPTYRREDGYILRPARARDAQAYWQAGYCPMDPELARLTGCKERFTREEVLAYFARCMAADDRCDFLLLSPEGKILGESVINEIDFSLRSANFRIALFSPQARGHGLGAWAIRMTQACAFDTLRLHRLSLDVFSFNTRAIRAYERAGFVREGVLRDAIATSSSYADDVLMAMLESEWRARQTYSGTRC